MIAQGNRGAKVITSSPLIWFERDEEDSGIGHSYRTVQNISELKLGLKCLA